MRAGLLVCLVALLCAMPAGRAEQQVVDERSQGGAVHISFCTS